jgi:glycosyltransferase involved in cell wall biosynthesis
MKVIAVVCDTYYYTNGVRTIYKNIIENEINNYSDKVTIVLIYMDKDKKESFKQVSENVYFYTHKPRFSMPTPGYSELILGIPRGDILQTIEGHLGKKIDLVHVSAQALLSRGIARMARKRGLPVTGFYHTFIPLYLVFYMPTISKKRDTFMKKFYRYIGKKVDRMVFKRCSRIICHTKRSADYIGQYLDAEFVYMTEFLNLNRFKPHLENINIDEEKKKRKDGKIHIGYIGRISKEKEVPTILSFQEEMKKRGMHLHLMGKGPLLEKVKEKYGNMEHITVYGNLLGEEFVKTVSSLDFNIVLTTTETLNLTILEAGACSVPSVGLKDTVPGDVISKYNSGIVIDHVKDSSWLDKIKDVYESNEYEKLRTRCLDMAEKNSLAIGTQRIVDFWLETIEMNSNNSG